MKPSWEDAPKWANYLAMEPSEEWYWYERIPYKNGFRGWNESSGTFQRCVPYEKINWSETLEQRP